MTISNNMKKHIHTIKKTLAPLSNNNYYRDDVIHTTLKECNMDYKETCRRLKMIHDVREIAGKHSVDDVYVMLKECNLDPDEAAQKLLYIGLD
ncbi:GBF-interacting protein 1-like protein isoform X1 [Tanacetum coccineum]